MISKQIEMTTWEEHDTKFGPIARFSFGVGTLTRSPTPNELEKIVKAGHIPHPNQFPCDVAGNKFPTSVLNMSGNKLVKPVVVVGSFLALQRKAIYCFPCRLFSHVIDHPNQSSLASPSG